MADPRKNAVDRDIIRLDASRSFFVVIPAFTGYWFSCYSHDFLIRGNSRPHVHPVVALISWLLCSANNWKLVHIRLSMVVNANSDLTPVTLLHTE